LKRIQKKNTSLGKLQHQLDNTTTQLGKTSTTQGFRNINRNPERRTRAHKSLIPEGQPSNKLRETSKDQNLRNTWKIAQA